MCFFPLRTMSHALRFLDATVASLAPDECEFPLVACASLLCASARAVPAMRALAAAFPVPGVVDTWKGSAPCAFWKGVTCDGSGEVESIRL